MNSTKKTMQVCGRETRPILKFVKNLPHLVYLSIFAKCLWWRYRIGCTNVWRLMCYSWAIRPSFILRPRSPVRYNLITKSLLQNVSYIHFFAIYRVFFFFCLFLCIRFVFGIFARFKPKKSHARRSRTIIVRPFAFPYPASVTRASSYTYTHLSRLHAQFAATHTHVCVCIFMYKQALRGVDSDPDSRADKNSSQSIIRFMNMYV